MIGGGAPPGSTVLLAGEVGAGARAFCYTSAILSAIANVDEESFDLHYGDLHEESKLPEEVHYLSLTASEDAIVEEMEYTIGDKLVDSGSDPIHFKDLSHEYFQVSQVPSEWYAQRPPDITSLGEHHDRRNVFDAIGDYLSANGEGNLVVVDSVTDLISVASDEMDWTQITLLMKGLKKASHRWDGLVLLLVTLETLSDTQLGQLMEASDGTIFFEWESGGSERARTMFVKQFRGVLSRLEDENIIQFETEIHDSGFDISDIRKIR
jgi:KaiC/GvpD/RAD55 family RecA-like ATPase